MMADQWHTLRLPPTMAHVWRHTAKKGQRLGMISAGTLYCNHQKAQQYPLTCKAALATQCIVHTDQDSETPLPCVGTQLVVNAVYDQGYIRHTHSTIIPEEERMAQQVGGGLRRFGPGQKDIAHPKTEASLDAEFCRQALLLSTPRGIVRATDLANQLGFDLPTVYRRLRKIAVQVDPKDPRQRYWRISQPLKCPALTVSIAATEPEPP